MNLDDAIDAFNAAEANLSKLDRLWSEMEEMLPPVLGGVVLGVSDPPAFKRKARQFRHILCAMPTIDGYAIEDRLPDADSLQLNIMDLYELGEMEAKIAFDQHIHSQGDALAEYRFHLDSKRRTLIRSALNSKIETIDQVLAELALQGAKWKADEDIKPEWVQSLRESVQSIDTMLGSSVARPSRWAALQRHLHFASIVDLKDVLKIDWPQVRGELERTVFDEDEPLKVAISDLGTLVEEHPTGSVVGALNWKVISPGEFERLIFSLLSGVDGYEDPQWLTQTNAPDRGRDLSVGLVRQDILLGTLRQRAIVACKHYLSKSVTVPEVNDLVAQMKIWEPPRVDVLIIATSGRFTSDAVVWIEKYNQEDHALRLEMWPDSHLECLLASRPALVAQFSLR